MATFVARPMKSRIVIGNDLRVETLDGEPVGEMRLHLGRPNEFSGRAGVIHLSRSGFAHPRFEARRADGTLVAALEYEFVTGAMDLLFTDPEGDAPPTRRRVVEEGVLLPMRRLVEPDGRVPLAIESWRLFGKELRITVEPDGTRWSEADLLAIAVLLVHAHTSLSILFTAAAGAGALAASGRSKGKGVFERLKDRLPSIG